MLQNREDSMLTSFQRRAHHYITDPPEFSERLDWLALMQHHGAPTRLVDFTHSFYVASFFATETAIGDYAIWCINLNVLDELLAKKIPYQIASKRLDERNREHINLTNRVLPQFTFDPFVINVEPFRLNERLAAQQGLFLIATNLDHSFLSNLATMLNVSEDIFDTTIENEWSRELEHACIIDKVAVLKCVFPHRTIVSTVRELRRMNITSATLFPGLDGFARSLTSHLQMHRTPRLVEEGIRKALARQAAEHSKPDE